MANLVAIQAQIEVLKRQAETIRSKEFASTVADIRAKMDSFGITIKDLQMTSKRASGKAKSSTGSKVKAPKAGKGPRSGVKVQAKYKGPNGEAWTGRGLTPKWLATLLAQGRNKDEFLVVPVAPPFFDNLPD